MVRALLAFVILLVAGCKSSPSFVGTWNSENEISGLKIKTKSEHRADGTFASFSKSTPTAQGTLMEVTDRGTWKLEGNKLRLRFTDVDWTFKGGKPELIKKAKERFQSNKDNVIAEANRIGAMSLAWKSDDEFSVTDPDGEITIYRRVK